MTADFRKQETYPAKISDHIHVLGNYYFNIYLIRGEKGTALVETGISATVDSVIHQLEGLGEVPTHIVVTHPHSDHVTGLPGLMEKYPEARVVSGEGAQAFLEHPKAQKAMFYEDRVMSERMAEVGIEPGRPPIQKVPDLSGSVVVSERLDIDLGGVTLGCISVAGHSPGNIVVHVPEDKALLLSDSLGFHYPGRGFCPLFFTGFQEYLDTIALLKSFQPEMIGPAHQGPLFGNKVAQAFREAEESARRAYDKILSREVAPDLLAEELFDQYYVDEFTIYSRENIMNCSKLLVRRAREFTSMG